MKDTQWAAKLRGNKFVAMWLLSALGGMLAITLTIGIGISSHATGSEKADNLLFVLARLLFPVGILLLYAWRGYEYANSTGGLKTLRRARLGQLADSLYFLGFLWTLWALIDSFVIHQMSIAEAVFRAFGYALVTTALGMFLRLLLLQFAYSEEEQVRLGEQTVEEEIALFTQEVHSAVESLSAFRTRTDDAVATWVESLNKSGTDLKVAVNDVTDQTTDLKDALLKMHEASAEHVDSLVGTALNQFTRRLEPSLEALNNANNNFVSQVNNSTTNLTKSLQSSTAQVQAAIDKGVKQVETAAEAGAMQMVSELANASSAIKTSLEKSTHVIEAASSSLATTLSTQKANLESDLANLSSQIQEIHVPVDVIEKTVSQQLSALNSTLLKSTETVEQETTAFSKAVSGQIANLELDLARILKQIREVQIPSDIVEKRIEQQLLPVSTVVRKSAQTIEEASSKFATTVSSQRLNVESDLASLSMHIRDVRVPADMVERALEQNIRAVNAILLKSNREIERATVEFKTALSAQLPNLILEMRKLSQQIEMLGTNKHRWWSWLFGHSRSNYRGIN